MGILLISLGICVVLIEETDVAEQACEYMSTIARIGEETTPMENCVKHTRMWIYIMWGAAATIFVTTQYIIVSIFRAYRDEIKVEEVPDKQQYDLLPGHDDL